MSCLAGASINGTQIVNTAGNRDRVAVTELRREREESKIELAHCQVAQESLQNPTPRRAPPARVSIFRKKEVNLDEDIRASAALK